MPQEINSLICMNQVMAMNCKNKKHSKALRGGWTPPIGLREGKRKVSLLVQGYLLRNKYKCQIAILHKTKFVLHFGRKGTVYQLSA